MYGYGTGWLWYYYPTLLVQFLTCFYLAYSLRFSQSTLSDNRAVQIWSVVISVSIYMQLLVPLPGCIANHFLHLVPFQKPLWHFAWIYMTVCCSINVLKVMQNSEPQSSLMFYFLQLPLDLMMAHVCLHIPLACDCMFPFPCQK